MTDEKTTNELLRDSRSLLVRTALRLAEVEKERDALMVATGEDGPKITRTILEAQAAKIARLEARDEQRDKEVRADAIMWAADKYDLPAEDGGGVWAAVRAWFRRLSEEVRRG